MMTLKQSASTAVPNKSTGSAATGQRMRPATPVTAPANTLVTARDWFALGERVPYDYCAREIVRPDETPSSPDVLRVFRRIVKDGATPEDAVWTSFLSGWPDGSYGWAMVNQHLTGANLGPRLFFDYVGHGDSDKPDDYSYGTIERANLVEAMWRAEGITSTFVVCFDYSSIVALELLSRQLDRREQGITSDTKIEGVLLINGGLFVDAHSHPWYTTPVLKSAVGGLVTSVAQRSKRAFTELMKPLWSASYPVTSEEIDEILEAISRRNGVGIMAKSAGFVDQHKRNADRWDLSRLYLALRNDVSFHIVGSEEDPFEGRQAVVARERLGAFGLDVRILPGGHLTTSEHPDLLADIIKDVAPHALAKQA